MKPEPEPIVELKPLPPVIEPEPVVEIASEPIVELAIEPEPAPIVELVIDRSQPIVEIAP
ncbi:hypothetical protein [Chromatium okenii]|uniref:hypothetical protein n=1 Tax=Chromatium okenii TaxID=61644 RepID=UPI0018D55E9B|nr:hypothetical protein [Chromatium okenii]